MGTTQATANGLEMLQTVKDAAKAAAAAVKPNPDTGKVSKAARKRAYRAAIRDNRRAINEALKMPDVYINGLAIRSCRSGQYGSLHVSNYDQSAKAKKAKTVKTSVTHS